MFQFTTTNVLNSNKRGNDEDIWTGEDGIFMVKRVGIFKPENVKDAKVYKSEGHLGTKAVATIDFNSLDSELQVKGQPLRINMYIGLSEGSNFSLYANDYYFKGKPFVVDFAFGDDVEDTVEKLVKTIKKYLVAVHGEKMVNVTNEGSGSLKIEAVNEYQKFIKVQLDAFDPEAHHNMGEYKLAVEAEITPNKEGFGTYSYILHNLRLPTRSHTDYMAVGQDEMPIIGALYNEYVIHMCVDRGTLGLNAVGDQVTSHTTHVFYVNQDYSAEFEGALETAGFTLETIDEPEY